LASAFRTTVRALEKFRFGATQSPGPSAAKTAGRSATVPPAQAASYAGDFRGVSAVRYAPQPDGSPDPGEVVWTWVPYEEDHSRGKDRPVLLVGHHGPHLLALMLTSKDHDQVGNRSEDYVDIGTGNWDRQQRPSEANLGRVLQISPDSIRREGAVLDRKRFEAVAAGLRHRHGWK
jgi:hypothetical protein